MAKVWRIFRLFYPDLFKVPLGEATDYPLPRYAEEWKLCRRLQDIVDRPPLAVGMARKAGLDYYPGSPSVPGVDDPGVFLRPALAERRFRVRHGAIATAELKKVETFSVPGRIKYFPLTPQWWDELKVPRGMPVRVGEVPALRGSGMIKGHPPPLCSGHPPLVLPRSRDSGEAPGECQKPSGSPQLDGEGLSRSRC